MNEIQYRINYFLEQNSEYRDLIIASVIFISVSLVLFLIKFIVSRYAKKKVKLISSDYGQVITHELSRFPLWVNFSLSAFFALQYFRSVSENIKTEITVASSVILLLILAFFVTKINRIIDKITRLRAKEYSDRSKANAVLYLSIIVRSIIWIFILIVFLSELGYDVSALIAGLGVTGVAIGFAMRELISDVVSSFLIVFYRPIQVGDRIIADGNFGTVKRIGIQSISLETPDKHKVIIPNRTIIDKTTKNFKLNDKHKLEFTVDIAFKKYKELKVVELLKKSLLKEYMPIMDSTFKMIATKLTSENTAYKVSFVYKTTPEIIFDEEIEKIINSIYKTLKTNKIGVTSVSLDSDLHI